jgi:hypothetical protein
VETVTTPVTTQPTKIRTLLSGSGIFGGGPCWWLGDLIVVFSGASVTDSATLSGANVSSAGGTVTYTVYSWFWPYSHVVASETVPVTNGVVPSSNPVILKAPGIYFWQVSYTGDSRNQPSTSAYGSEIETVVPVPQCSYGWNWGLNASCKMKKH